MVVRVPWGHLVLARAVQDARRVRVKSSELIAHLGVACCTRFLFIVSHEAKAHLPSLAFSSILTVTSRPPSNQSLQLTAGRSGASHYIMKSFPLQPTLAPAGGS